MLDSLKFVQGAVAKRTSVPELTHFRIKDGRVKGYNGRLALCAPIPLNIDVVPKAVPFYRAIQTCKDTVQLNLTPSGRISVRSKKFRAYVECLEDEAFPDVEPEGEFVEIDGHLLDSLKTLEPFIADDASRQWARGILFRGASAYATNNIVLIEKWLGYNFPHPINIPKDAVQEILRINEEPVRLQVTERNITFHYSNDRWLKSQNYDLAWPDLSKILDNESTPVKLSKWFFERLPDLLPFLDKLERVYLIENGLTTSLDDEIGAKVTVKGVQEKGCYNYHQLLLLEPVLEKIDFSRYPKPALFFGDKLRGAIIGIRV